MVSFKAPQHVFTAGDIVAGNVRVDPATRPVTVSITFTGLSWLHGGDTNRDNFAAQPKLFEHNVSTQVKLFEYTQRLFTSSGIGENFEILRRGTAEDGKVELPFSFTFPHTATLDPPEHRGWVYSQDTVNHPRFQHSPGFALPQTCTIPTEPVPSKIFYCLDAHMDCSMPDTNHFVSRVEVQFMPPTPIHPAELLQPDMTMGVTLPKGTAKYKLIRTRRLLPGYAESSKMGKVRDILVEKELFFGLNSYAEVPFFRFNILANPARIGIVGRELPVTLILQEFDRSKVLPEAPALFLRRLRVQINHVYSSFYYKQGKTKFTPREIVDVFRVPITLFDQKYESGDGVLLADWMKLSDIGDIRLPHGKIVPGFTSYGVTLEHEVQIDIWGECAKTEFSGVACKQSIQLLPDRQGDSPIEDTAALPRPEYTEVDPMLSSLEPRVSREVRNSMSTTSPHGSQVEVVPSARVNVPPPPYTGRS